jgi:hypothetical protein
MPSIRAIVSVVLLSFVAVGCAPADRLFGGGDSRSSSTTVLIPDTPPSWSVAELSRVGGVAGVSHVLKLRADGTYTLLQAGRVVQTSDLSDAERARLGKLLTGPGLVRDAQTHPAVNCADGFIYRLTVGRVVVERTDCGHIEDAPTLEAVVELLGPRLRG